MRSLFPPGLPCAVLRFFLLGCILLAQGRAEERPPAPAEGPARPPAPAQSEPPGARPAAKRLRIDPSSFPGSTVNHFTLSDTEAAGYFSGSVFWSYTVDGLEANLLADRAALFVTAPGDSADRTEAALLDLRTSRNWTLYAEKVRLEIPARGTVLEADSLLYERGTGRAIARGVRFRTTVATARVFPSVIKMKTWQQGLEALDRFSESGDEFARTPLSIHAKVLRLRGFEAFDGEEIEASTCDFGVPHLALAFDRATVTPIKEDSPSGPESRKAPGGGSPAAAPGGEELDHKAFLIDPEGTWLDVEGHPIFPFPLAYWDTRWQTASPIRKVDFGHSGQFGLFGEVNWNVNYFLNLLPTSRFLPLDIDDGADLGLETDLYEKRGFALGPNAIYGRNPKRWDPWQIQQQEWRYYGEAQYYFLTDHGEKDRTTRQPVPRDTRYWGHAWHRQSVPYLGLFDLEYSKLSDGAFLGEYFERVAKEEKEQETLVYWRRNFRDNLTVTGLYSQRINDFQSQTERAPEGKVFLSDQPVFESGLYTDLNLQAAYLHRLEADPAGGTPRGYSRADVLNQWSYPIHLLSPYLEARPFAVLRYTEYGEVLDEAEGSEGRATFGAGVAVSQHWSKVYQFEKDSLASRLLGVPALKHVVSPKVTYLNLFSNDLAPENTLPVDAVDTVDLQESVSFSLRNEVFARVKSSRKLAPRVRPYLGNREGELATVPFELRRVLDSEVSFALFPRARRDNGGDRSSLLILDNTASVVPGLAVRGWFELNPNRDFRMERADGSVTYDIVPGRFSVTVGDRLTRQRSNVGYAFFSWWIGEKWFVDAYYSRDFEQRRDLEYRFALNRVFHRLAISLEYSQDVGEDRNSTVYFNLAPVEMLQSSRHGHRR